MKRAAFLAGSGAAIAWLRTAPANAASLHAKIRELGKTFSGAIGVYARTLSPGGTIAAYRAFESFPTASTIKVLIMTTAYAMDELHPGTLDGRVVFHSSDLISGSDFLADAPDGERFSLRELLVPMITVSDNTAANLLIGYLGLDTINDVAASAGLTQTRLGRKFVDASTVIEHSDNVSSPADMAHLLYLIERGAHEGTRTIVSAAHCRTMVDILLRQTDRDAIPAALPAGTPVANKTGEIEGTRDDVAIVRPFGDAPYVLAIMTKDAYDYDASYAAIHAVTREVNAAARS